MFGNNRRCAYGKTDQMPEDLYRTPLQQFSPRPARRKKDPVLLTVDEYESLRLIDYEKRTHEQCARQMGISRTTVTEIYERARTKVADCLVNGKPLKITGGNYGCATVQPDSAAAGHAQSRFRKQPDAERMMVR